MCPSPAGGGQTTPPSFLFTGEQVGGCRGVPWSPRVRLVLLALEGPQGPLVVMLNGGVPAHALHRDKSPCNEGQLGAGDSRLQTGSSLQGRLAPCPEIQ